MKYKIEINRDDCTACSTCYSSDPTHFESDSEGKAKVVNGNSNGASTGNFDDDNFEDAKTAADTCPVNVITVIEV
jgi:ferredoxin